MALSAELERPGVNHPAWAPGPERDAVELVASRVNSFENSLGVDFRERCEHFYRLYRGFKKFRYAWEAAGPNDRDGVLYDAKKTWGANLHIPLSFRTIETMVPRAIAHRPRMLYLPRQERWQENVENIRLLIDSQQDQIDIELSFQDVMRAGMIYGIGFAKSYWRTEWAPRRRVKRRMFKPDQFKPGRLFMEKVFDDPDFEDVDVFDLMWDPFGSDLNRGSSRCRWIVHRVWLGLDQCLERVQSGVWNTESAKGLTEERLRSMGNGQKYDEIWNERMAASGFGNFTNPARGEHVHEVWECHDGHQVWTVLDRALLVQEGESPCVGMIPFQTYRPTRIPKQMVGIGEIEPIQHLQRELDTLRSQRRDAATIALCAGYAYDAGMVDKEDIVFGPAALIEMTNGRPSDGLMPLQVRDIPGSGYQEEQVIRTDFDAVTGINDALDPSSGGQIQTATEAQLVQAALSKRIELKSRRFEVEVVRYAAKCFLYLNQRMIIASRDPIRQPDEGYDMADAAREGRWRWFEIGPGELQGEFEIVPEGGSMAAENVPQMRQDAQIFLGPAFQQNPFIDQRRPLVKGLQLMGVKDPEAWLKQSDPPVPPLALEVLQKMGVDPRVIQRAVTVAQQQDPRLALQQQAQQGPNADQVDQMMGQAA